MDIDDILDSLNRDDNIVLDSASLDHQQLTRFWVTERGAPELLPWPGPLMDRMMERVRKQIEIMEDVACSGSNVPRNNPTTNPSLNLKLSILQSDLSRTQYLIRALLRQRLSKLTKYSLYYLNLSSPSSGEDQQSLLSPQESRFLNAHQSLLTAHYHASFLSAFPAQLRRLDDNAGGTNMVEGPETKEVVFVRCLEEKVNIVVPVDGPRGVQELHGSTMKRGEVWAVRWEGVKEAWKRGDVEVL